MNCIIYLSNSTLYLKAKGEAMFTPPLAKTNSKNSK